MTIISAFQAALGRSKSSSASEAPVRARPGSEGASLDVTDDSSRRVVGVSIPVGISNELRLGGEGYAGARDDNREFPRYEPDDEEVLFRLFRVRV